MPLLARVVGIYAAGKLFVLFTLALMAGGTAALHRALHCRTGPWPLVSFLFLYNFIFPYGFLNYLFATAVALWGTAAWIHLRRSSAWRRAAVSTLFILALLASHFLDIVLYGLAVLCYEVWRWRERRPADGRNALVLEVPFLVVPPLLLLSPTSGFAVDTGWQLWPAKFEGLYFLVKSYTLPADARFALALAAGAAWGFSTRRLRLHPVARLYLPAAAIAYLATPAVLANAGVVDMRLPRSFVFFAVAVTDWENRNAHAVYGFLAGAVALAAMHFAVIGG